MLVSLAKMKTRQKGKVVAIHGGQMMLARLNAMGIRIGAWITQKSAQPLQGPLILDVGTIRLAIGFGMAQKIMVEVQE